LFSNFFSFCGFSSSIHHLIQFAQPVLPADEAYRRHPNARETEAIASEPRAHQGNLVLVVDDAPTSLTLASGSMPP